MTRCQAGREINITATSVSDGVIAKITKVDAELTRQELGTWSPETVRLIEACARCVSQDSRHCDFSWQTWNDLSPQQS